MKRIIILTAAILFAVNLFAGDNTATLTIEVTDVTETKGTILCAVYGSKESFLKKGDYNVKAEANGNTVLLTLANLPAGEKYAVSLYHDVNDNRELDKGKWGIPAEPYGFSNNAKGFMGPPKFDAAAFTVEGDTTVSIALKQVKMGN